MEIGCLICQDSLTPNVDCQATKCGHVFHQKCLIPWIRSNPTCPTCRAHSPVTSLYRIYFTANPSDESLRTDELLRVLTTSVHSEQNLQLELATARRKIATLEQSPRPGQLLRDLSTAKRREQTLKNELSDARSEITDLEESMRSLESKLGAADFINMLLSGKNDRLEERVKELTQPKARQYSGDDTEIIEAFRESLRDIESPLFPSVHKFRCPSAPTQMTNVSYLEVFPRLWPKESVDYKWDYPRKLVLKYTVDGEIHTAFYRYVRDAQKTEPQTFDMVPFHKGKDCVPFHRVQAKVSLKNHAHYCYLHLPSSIVLTFKVCKRSDFPRRFYEMVKPITESEY